MNPSATDITLNPKWLEENSNRLIAFEILQRHLFARHQEMPPEVLADKIGMDKGFSHKVIQRIKHTFLNGQD